MTSVSVLVSRPVAYHLNVFSSPGGAKTGNMGLAFPQLGCVCWGGSEGWLSSRGQPVSKASLLGGRYAHLRRAIGGSPLCSPSLLQAVEATAGAIPGLEPVITPSVLLHQPFASQSQLWPGHRLRNVTHAQTITWLPCCSSLGKKPRAEKSVSILFCFPQKPRARGKTSPVASFRQCWHCSIE